MRRLGIPTWGQFHYKEHSPRRRAARRRRPHARPGGVADGQPGAGARLGADGGEVRQAAGRREGAAQRLGPRAVRRRGLRRGPDPFRERCIAAPARVLGDAHRRRRRSRAACSARRPARRRRRRCVYRNHAGMPADEHLQVPSASARARTTARSRTGCGWPGATSGRWSSRRRRSTCSGSSRRRTPAPTAAGRLSSSPSAQPARRPLATAGTKSSSFAGNSIVAPSSADL